MLRKMFSLGALVVVAVTFGVGNAAAKPSAKPPKAADSAFAPDGFSDGRLVSVSGGSSSDGFSDGRD
jgi:hypothetical protein